MLSGRLWVVGMTSCCLVFGAGMTGAAEMLLDVQDLGNEMGGVTVLDLGSSHERRTLEKLPALLGIS